MTPGEISPAQVKTPGIVNILMTSIFLEYINMYKIY